jgi:hypothetical protein
VVRYERLTSSAAGSTAVPPARRALLLIAQRIAVVAARRLAHGPCAVPPFDPGEVETADLARRAVRRPRTRKDRECALSAGQANVSNTDGRSCVADDAAPVSPTAHLGRCARDHVRRLCAQRAAGARSGASARWATAAGCGTSVRSGAAARDVVTALLRATVQSSAATRSDPRAAAVPRDSSVVALHARPAVGLREQLPSAPERDGDVEDQLSSCTSHCLLGDAIRRTGG